jgi:transposase IS116/IS110/IS902 family protein
MLNNSTSARRVRLARNEYSGIATTGSPDCLRWAPPRHRARQARAGMAGLCPLWALPGAGPALAPRLLVAFGERRERFPDAASLQQNAGVAPITKRSGNKSSSTGAISAQPSSPDPDRRISLTVRV